VDTATELIRMAYRLLSMNHITRTNIIKQAEIQMSDGSALLYNIDITLQTELEHSIAYGKITDLNNALLLDPIERSIVGLLNDCPEGDDEDPQDSIDD
jgi:hypothetical protein